MLFDALKSRSEKLGLVTFQALLVLIFLFGGASRADALSQPVVRLGAVAAIFLVMIWATPDGLRRIRTPLLLLTALAVVVGWQLLPVPFSLWEELSGRGPWAGALKMAGLGNGWRPISMAPDLTWNSLLALLPMSAVVLAAALIRPKTLGSAIPVLLIALLLSALLSIVQVSSGRAYFYAVTNAANAVGLFANRNHQAMFLACGLPLLACWVGMRAPSAAVERLRGWIAICSAAGLYPLCLITGSRAGLLLAVIGTFLALLLWLPTRRSRSTNPWPVRIMMIAPVLIGFLAIIVAVAFSRDVAVLRLTQTQAKEIRFELIPTYLQMVRDFFPLGSGFGTFDPVFRYYEPVSLLRTQYMNEAHNDWLQLLIEGGAPALLLLLVFLGLFFRRAWALWRAPELSERVLLGRTGSIIIVMLGMASLVDYPLRTPFLGSLFALAALWVFRARDARDANRPPARVGSGEFIS